MVSDVRKLLLMEQGNHRQKECEVCLGATREPSGGEHNSKIGKGHICHRTYDHPGTIGDVESAKRIL